MLPRGLVVIVLCCIAASAAAQTIPERLPSRPVTWPAPAFVTESASQQLIVLERWSRDYAEWKAWFLQWRNRREPGVWNTRARRQPPVPPDWLRGTCASLLDESGPLADACLALRDWDSDDLAASVMAQQMNQARSSLEAPDKTQWWERIHVDGLWPMTRAGSNALGIVGMHTTMRVTGRMQVFMAPGIIMMRLPALTGGMMWSAATDWGFSYRLFDFRMPALRRASSLDFNMVRVWVLGEQAVLSPGEMYLAGFSATFKRR